MMKSLFSKKGQVSAMGPAIIALVIAGVFLILGVVILQEIRDTDIIMQANSGSVTNETMTTVSTTGKLVAKASSPGFNSFSVSFLSNSTGGEIIPASNYTVSSTGKISTSCCQWNSTNLNVSYTYRYADEAYLAGNETVVGLGTFGEFWEIIVLALVVSIVIGLLLIVFGGRRAR